MNCIYDFGDNGLDESMLYWLVVPGSVCGLSGAN
jgi:hypothetical protein